MSRPSPQSISPQRGPRHYPHSLTSDANIRNFAPVARIMKLALPENAKIAKEAKECMQECVSEFISFITSEGISHREPSCAVDPHPDPPSASEKCQQEKRKTVNGEDILFAMTSLGFENYAEALKIYLSKYREVCIPYSFLAEDLHPLVTVLCIRADSQGQTQSARGENQPRPTSGYGAPAGPGTVGSGNLVGGPAVSSSSAFPGHSEGVNNATFGPHGLDPSDQDTNPYSNVYPPVDPGQHGAGAEPY